MKKSTTKLVLTLERVRILTVEQLATAGGGWGNTLTIPTVPTIDPDRCTSGKFTCGTRRA